MTEQEAAERLCALLNEIEAAGVAVQITPNFGRGYHLSMGDGDVYLEEPRWDDESGEPWKVRP